jgi:hypothetical protein
MLANPEREPLVLGLKGLALRPEPGGARVRPAPPARPSGARRPTRGGRVPVAPVPADEGRAPRSAAGAVVSRLRGPPPKD